MPDLPGVWADRQSLMQVFLNLTRNSERAMRDRGRRELSIRAFGEPQRVYRSGSRDTGCGSPTPTGSSALFSSRRMPRVWGLPFARLHAVVPRRAAL